jgi:hypothetical protein
MKTAEVAALVQPGESVSPIIEPAHASQGWAYGFSVVEISDSTNKEGNSVALVIEPGGAVEPVLITGDITLTVRSLHGTGVAVINSMENPSEVHAYPQDDQSPPITLGKGDAYYYLNTGEEPLVLRDDCVPAFQGHEELQLTTTPIDRNTLDGRQIVLPPAF